MKNIRAFLLVVFVSTLGFVGGCKKWDELASPPQAEDCSFKKATPVTIGNHTYIRMDIVEYPDKCTTVILGMLMLFEQEHPELEVISWSIEKRFNSVYMGGLWVNHRPRTDK